MDATAALSAEARDVDAYIARAAGGRSAPDEAQRRRWIASVHVTGRVATAVIVDELQPKPGDILVPKSRYSGFFNTNMDSVLRARGIRNLVFVGIATNVCVESTLRDGFMLEYFGTVLEDATHQAGPEFVQRAALYNIETFFGWVSSVADFKGVVGQIAPDA